jgi:hypothetical protein
MAVAVSRLRASWRTALTICALLCLSGSQAHAYRPFDSTDAAVADKGEIELECGPAGYVVSTDGRFLVVPAAILNIGVADGWEVVAEGRHFVRLSAMSERTNTIRDTAISIKGVLRQGSLQDRAGPSIAIETGLLLPGVGIDPGVGLSVAGIVSQRVSSLTFHVNGEWFVTHEHTNGSAAGAIVEGPARWTIRPVGELTVEQKSGITVSSALIGAIWQLRPHLSVDVGWRNARSDGTDAREIRAGFTLAFSLGARHDVQPLRPAGIPSRGRFRA